MSKSTRVRQQIVVAPKAAENDDVHAAITLPSSGTTVVTTAITNPDVPRTVRLKGNQSTTQGLVVVLVGTDILDKPITESVTMGNAFATPTDSTRAFKTVTSITVPTRGGASDSISVGLGAALGLDCYCDAYSFLGSYALLEDTHAFHATEISKNVAQPHSGTFTINGSNDVAFNYIPQSFPDFGRSWA